MGLMSSMITESGQKVAAVNEGEQLVNYKSLKNEIQGSPRKQQRRVEARFILVKTSIVSWRMNVDDVTEG